MNNPSVHNRFNGYTGFSYFYGWGYFCCADKFHIGS